VLLVCDVLCFTAPHTNHILCNISETDSDSTQQVSNFLAIYLFLEQHFCRSDALHVIQLTVSLCQRVSC